MFFWSNSVIRPSFSFFGYILRIIIISLFEAFLRGNRTFSMGFYLFFFSYIHVTVFLLKGCRILWFLFLVSTRITSTPLVYRECISFGWFFSKLFLQQTNAMKKKRFTFCFRSMPMTLIRIDLDAKQKIVISIKKKVWFVVAGFRDWPCIINFIQCFFRLHFIFICFPRFATNQKTETF